MIPHTPGGLGSLMPVSRSPRPTVLLVDTDDAARRAARKAFEREGFRVVEARGGGHALRVCEYIRGRVDVLITEVAIPQPNGVAVAEAVSAWWPSVVVLFMSDGVVAVVTRFLGPPNVRRVLGRPLAAEQLVETTRRLLIAQ